MTTCKLQVNGKPQEVDVDADTPLLYVLRNDLKLNGAKFGCGLGQCGSCTVMLDKQPTKEFVTPEQVAALAVFLCRDESKAITGANLSVDGGWTAM